MYIISCFSFHSLQPLSALRALLRADGFFGHTPLPGSAARIPPPIEPSTRSIPTSLPAWITDQSPPVYIFAFFFAYTGSVLNVPQSPQCDFAIKCKHCRETIPAPCATVPDTSFLAVCPFCDEKRRYLPQEIFRGKLSHRVWVRSNRV